MDPVSAVSVGLATRFLGDGIVSLGRLLGTDEQVSTFSIPLTSEDGEVEAVLTSSQLDNAERVLRDPRSKVLAESLGLIPLVAPEAASAVAMKKMLRTQFLAVAVESDSELPDSTWDLIWDKLESQMDAISAQMTATTSLSSRERAKLQESLVGISVEGHRRARVPKWLRDLAALGSDRDALLEASELGEDIRRALGQQLKDLKFEHALEDVRRPIADLYIDRTLRTSDGAEVDSSGAFAELSRCRVVVTGAPGAGKTTLTQHVLNDLCRSEDAPVPLRLRAREVDLETELLTAELASACRRDLQLSSITEQAVERLLILGRAFVVFDGLDEVLSPSSRRKFVARVEAFADAYPLSSILVTSRDVGYEDAPVDSARFSRNWLLPFDIDQVHEYAKRWFLADPGTSDLLEPFLEDVESVPDLRENPLMLSLLCTLYKAKRQIPRNRRQVYEACADLLFRRWDALRDIDQPFDSVQHGKDLFEDIAHFYLNFESAQRGVPESVLRGIVSKFLQSSAAVLESDADRRAENFVQFCSGRAWLIGQSGTSAQGERLFVFTHRTFMEFFAAESLARRGLEAEALADIICKSYNVNPSSVLPELIIAGAEASTLGAGREIIQAIKERERLIGGKGRGRYLPLRLRLALVMTLRPQILDEILRDALNLLAEGEQDLRTPVFTGILDLPRDPRARLEAHLTESHEVTSLTDSSGAQRWRRAFLREWELVRSNRQSGSHSAEWSSVVERVWEMESKSAIEAEMSMIRRYAIDAARMLLPLGPQDLSLWIVRSRRLQAPGLALSLLERQLSGVEADPVDEHLLREFSDLRRPTTVYPYVADQVRQYLMDVLQIVPTDLAATDLSDELRHLLLATVMTSVELLPFDDPESSQLTRLVGFDISRLQATREASARRRKSRADTGPRVAAEPFSQKTIDSMRDLLPSWGRAWAKSTLTLVNDQDDWFPT